MRWWLIVAFVVMGFGWAGPAFGQLGSLARLQSPV